MIMVRNKFFTNIRTQVVEGEDAELTVKGLYKD